MPSLIDIRRRIRAVKSTQQITKAMKMVAASRLRRAQERIVNARPFALQMQRVLRSLAGRVDPSTHPLLAVREQRPDSPTLLVVVTADRGLCGSFNTNIVKTAGQFLTDGLHTTVELGLVGKKGRDFFKRQRFPIKFEEVNVFNRLQYTDAQAIARSAIEEFTSGTVDHVYLIYNEFKSVLQQRIAVERLLPIPRVDVEGADGLGGPPEGRQAQGASREARTRVGVAPHAQQELMVDYLYEPAPEVIFEELLPRYVEVQVFRALLESAAAEHAARMMAMDSATKNSADLIEQLTLYMNKVRQAAITREIIEVVSGAQAT